MRDAATARPASRVARRSASVFATNVSDAVFERRFFFGDLGRNVRDERRAVVPVGETEHDRRARAEARRQRRPWKRAKLADRANAELGQPPRVVGSDR
jgi:hypothetical protein